MPFAPVLSKDQWQAVRLHLAANRYDYAATGDAFGVNPKTVRRRCEKLGWRNVALQAQRESQRSYAAAMTQSIEKVEETLNSVMDSTVFNVAKAAKVASEGLVDKEGKLTVRMATIQDHTALYLAAHKLSGRDKPDTQVNVSLWAGLAGGEVSAAPVMEAEVVEDEGDGEE